MAIVENTLQSIYDHLLYLSGQPSSQVKIADAVRLFNYALNDYTHLALSADGRWQAADRLDNGLNAYTTPIVSSNEYRLQADFLKIDKVEVITADATNEIDPDDYKLDGDILSLDDEYTSGTLKIYPSLPFGHFESTTLTQEVGIPSIHLEYLVFHALHRLSLRLSDTTRAQVRQELEVITNRVRDHYNKRDEDTPRRLIGLVNVIE